MTAADFPVEREKFLLLGGSGFLGSNLGQALMDQGHEIVVVDLMPPRWDMKAYGDRGVFVRAGLSDIDLLSGIFANHRIGTVLHLASFLLPGSSIEDLCREVQLNFVPSLRLFDLMQGAGIRRFVFLGTGGAIYGSGGALKESDPLQPLNYYGWMKLAFEEFIRLRSRVAPLDYLVLRPSNPYGRYQSLRGRQGLVAVVLGRILDQARLEVWGDGSVVRDFLYIEDFCAAVVALIAQQEWNATFNIGSGTGHSVLEVVEAARRVTGRPLEVDFRPARSVDAPIAVLDVSKLRSRVAFAPRSLEEGMTRYWEAISEGHPS